MKPEDYQKIITNAIAKEVEAYTFYRSVSDKAKDPAMKKVFNELAGEETTHRELLQGLLARGPTALGVLGIERERPAAGKHDGS